MKKTITKEFKFDSAHRLHDSKLTDDENKRIFGKCSRLHGHTYHLFVTVSGKEENGMIMNFTTLKLIVNRNVVDIFDHHYLNEVPEMKGILTTCENQINVVWDLLVDDLEMLDVQLEELKLYETETSFAILKR